MGLYKVIIGLIKGLGILLYITSVHVGDKISQARHKRGAAYSLGYSRYGWTSVIQDRLMTDPCNQRAIKSTSTAIKTTDELYFCYQSNSTVSTIVFEAARLKVGGWDYSSWAGYDWYLDGDKDIPGHDFGGAHNWKDVFATTGSWPSGSYGTSARAKAWARQVSLQKTKSAIMIKINTTANPLGKPQKWGPYENPTCHGLALCIWRNTKDPCLIFYLCPNITEVRHGKTPSRLPNITPGPRSDAVETPLIIQNPDTDDWFKMTTGISKISNNWLLMVEQAAEVVRADCVVCMGPRPLLKVVPSLLDSTCLLEVMNKTNPGSNCTKWDSVFPMTIAQKDKPTFSKDIAPNNFTCVNITGFGKRLGSLNVSYCDQTVNTDITFRPLSRSDIWWWCGGTALYDRLPYNITGLCASVTLILPISVYQLGEDMIAEANLLSRLRLGRHKRSLGWDKYDPTYIDSIGVPRGVPDEYKLVNQVSAGFESLFCVRCTVNKNVDRINYIHYNVQRLGNHTEDGFRAVHEQLSATSLMAFQNRIAVDMLLAEKGGVCAIFGGQCCTFIPNNTAADGTLTRALEGLRSLNAKMKEHSGVDTSMWDNFGEMFGKYRALIMSILLSLAVFTAILVLCGCCCIPCIRALCLRMITTAINPVSSKVEEMYALLPMNENPEEDDDTDGDDGPNLPDLFPDPDDYESNL